MSLGLDRVFIDRLAYYLDKFEWVTSEKALFRCPLCGDSPNPRSRHAAFIAMSDGYGFRCVRCNEPSSLMSLMRNLNPGLFREYCIEKFWSDEPRREQRESGELEIDTTESTELLNPLMSGSVQQAPDPTPLAELARVADLHPLHPAVKYLSARKIPIRDDILWTDNFSKWAQSRKPDTGRKVLDSDWRIVFPLVSADGIEFGAQGRVIVPTSTRLRYDTCIWDTRFRGFGLNRVDLTQEVWVTEGAIDSMATPNGVAAIGSDLAGFAADVGLDKSKTVLLFDNEPGSKQIVNLVRKAVKEGWRVGFWKKWQDEVGKDLGEAVFERGLRFDDLFEVASGLHAELVMSRWLGKF
mgnify:CR=1 FL=1